MNKMKVQFVHYSVQEYFAAEVLYEKHNKSPNPTQFFSALGNLINSSPLWRDVINDFFYLLLDGESKVRGGVEPKKPLRDRLKLPMTIAATCLAVGILLSVLFYFYLKPKKEISNLSTFYGTADRKADTEELKDVKINDTEDKKGKQGKDEPQEGKTSERKDYDTEEVSSVHVKEIEFSLDIGIYYEDEQGKLQYITEGSVLHSGDAYSLYVRGSDDCYLYIYQVDDLGRFYRLFPNEEYNTGFNPLRAGVDYWIPNTEECFVLDETTGKEHFYIFASFDKIIELEGASTLQQTDFDRVLKTMGVAGLKEKLKPYQVQPPKRIQAQVAEVKKKLLAEGASVYETWFWHR